MTRTKTLYVLLSLVAALALAAGALAGEVSQGKTLAYNQAAKTIQIEEYDTNFSADHRYGQPTGIVSDYDLARAKVGIPPAAGDVVRIAYDLEGERKVAIKVMNVSKQDLRKK